MSFFKMSSLLLFSGFDLDSDVVAVVIDEGLFDLINGHIIAVAVKHRVNLLAVQINIKGFHVE